jgi:hypothetical protein
MVVYCATQNNALPSEDFNHMVHAKPPKVRFMIRHVCFPIGESCHSYTEESPFAENPAQFRSNQYILISLVMTIRLQQ